MKKMRKTLLLFTLILCLVTLGLGIFTACDRKDGETIQYSVSVELPDGSKVGGVTVGFSIGSEEYGSAETDATGTAKIELTANIYTVSLSGLPEGYSYEGGVTTNRLGSPLTITLKQQLTTYTATVSLPDGTKAGGVTVVWSAGDKVVGEAETNDNGIASKELPEGTYAVTITNEPEGYWLENAVTVTAQSSSISITLDVDTRIVFNVTAQTEGGMKVRNIRLNIYKGTNKIMEVLTDKEGSAVFRLPEDSYTMLVICLTAGLSLQDENNSYTLDADHTEFTLTFVSQIIEEDPPLNKKYVLGDIMYDFELTAYNGSGPYVLSELLKEKDLVVINFWYTTCSWCLKEFPCLAEAYEEYKDKIEVIAVDPFDSANTILNFHQSYPYLTFPLVAEPTLVQNFIVPGYPTTVFIDRYGAVARIESGGIVYTEIWMDLFEEFTADDYTQTFTPGDEISEPEEFVPDIPDVEMPASSEIEAAINGDNCSFTYYPETGTNDAKYAWPFLVDEKDGKTVIKPANSGYRSSYSIIHTDMELKAGDTVAFDFLSSSEAYDILYVLVDSLVIWQISGVESEWETCFPYVALKDGTYRLTLLYMKDSTGNVGDDAVYVTNMRIVTTDAIETTTDIIRECSTDMNEAGTAYEDYITPVYNSEDGYYHVGTVNGPYILADLYHSTHWSNSAIYTYWADTENNFLYDLDGTGVKNYRSVLEHYLSLAVKSESYGLVPVDATLKKLLDAITEEFSENHHDKEWLEICKYYTRYGAEGEYPLPTLGLDMNTAITVTEGNVTFQTNRVIYPINSLVYKFVPEKTGVYLFTSHSPLDKEDEQTQAWLYTSEGIENGLIAYHGDDLLNSTADDDDGINFCIYAELTAGTPYFLECAFYWNDDTTLGKTFEFSVTYVDTYVKVMTNAASGAFTTTNDDLTGDIILEYAIDTILVDGKYYYKNADGTAGSLIYIDVETPTRAHDLMSLTEIAYSSLAAKDEPVISPFDFTRIQNMPSEYAIDYSETIKTLIANPNERGYVEATEELVNILIAYSQVYLFGIDNAWLQFAYYEHEYGTKPAEETPSTQTLYLENREEY